MQLNVWMLACEWTCLECVSTYLNIRRLQYDFVSEKSVSITQICRASLLWSMMTAFGLKTRQRMCVACTYLLLEQVSMQVTKKFQIQVNLNHTDKYKRLQGKKCLHYKLDTLRKAWGNALNLEYKSIQSIYVHALNKCLKAYILYMYVHTTPGYWGWRYIFGRMWWHCHGLQCSWTSLEGSVGLQNLVWKEMMSLLAGC